MRVRVIGRELVKAQHKLCEFAVEVDTHSRGWTLKRRRPLRVDRVIKVLDP
jgi:hypothetical protein